MQVFRQLFVSFLICASLNLVRRAVDEGYDVLDHLDLSIVELMMALIMFLSLLLELCEDSSPAELHSDL